MEVWKHIGGDGHVWKQTVGRTDDDSVCTILVGESDSVCTILWGNGQVQKHTMSLVDGYSVGRQVDGDSVDDGDVIRQCVGLGDSDSVSWQRRGIGDSMGVKGCDVFKLVSNNILRRENTARTPPSRMRSTGLSAGKCSRPGSGKTSTSPWRGVGAGSRTIGRTTTSTPGSKGSSLPSQRIAVASKVGNLIAMHHGLIREQTNRGVEPDQWPASRYSREQGTNGSQGARPGSQ